MPIKVLIIHRPPGTLGGDVGMASNYANQLRELGVDVDFLPADSMLDDLSGYDAAHMFAAVSPDWGLNAARRIKESGIPFLITPLYWPRDDRQQFFGGAPDIGLGFKQLIAAVMEQADTLACVTMGEAVKCWSLVPQKPAIVIGCALPDLGSIKPASQFDNSVVTIGRVERHKNQANLARACRSVGADLFCIGPLTDMEYASEVIAWGGRLLGEIDHEKTLAMLSMARVYANVSFGEIVSQATLEAALLGVPCVISTIGADPEYFGPGAHYCNPHDWRDIRDALVNAWNQEERHWFTPPESNTAQTCIDWIEAHG